MSSYRPSLWRVLSETSRIISAHSLHFFALSVLFLFPVSFAAAIYPFLLQPTSLHSHFPRFLSYVSTPDSDIPPVGKSQLLIQVVYLLSAFLFNLCAVPSITYTTFHGFYGRPVTFISSLKSILVSFFPLLATLLVAEVLLGLLVFGFIILVLVAYNGLALLGFETDYGNDYSLVFVILLAASLVGLMIYLQVEWYLMGAVVVLESEWGFAPLKRSSYLVKGMRGVVLLTVLFFGIPSVVLSAWYSTLVSNAGRINEGWTGWLVMEIVTCAGLSTILLLYGLAANTVLFVYCKALHGELAFQIVKEFDGEYVGLPFNVVNVV